MNWIKYSFRVPAEKLDIVTAVLTDVPYLQGIEIEDYSLTEEDCRALFVDILPEELNQKQESIPISFYLSEDMTEKAEEIKTFLRPFLCQEIVFTTYSTAEEDWANSWKKYYHSFAVGEKIFIYPIWEEADHNYPITIGLDPGMAFGSGTHETTELCLRALEKYMQPGDQVLDVGTGSGILAIAAAKLGAGQVLAIDLDENAVKVAKENVEFNGEQTRITVRTGNLAEGVTAQYEVVVANILAEVICLLAKDIKKFLKSGGIFITSGIIADKVGAVEKALTDEGLKVIEIAEKGEWRMVAAHA
ncbi:50S ribosomal protein L11 methyltransferase [Clostridiales bacterium COT073_COT-073]|nr:50S ribosomal protein L11 methyltransferase [Clostridiales bacterium COT073_COT-073]